MTIKLKISEDGAEVIYHYESIQISLGSIPSTRKKNPRNFTSTRKLLKLKRTEVYNIHVKSRRWLNS